MAGFSLDLDQEFADLRDIMNRLTTALDGVEHQTHALLVLRSSGILENLLEECLKVRFRRMSSVMESRLFGTYSPLGTFAAKIDMAYALEITDETVHEELNKFRKIRNLFAHHIGIVDLVTEPVKTIFSTLKRPPGVVAEASKQFMLCALAIEDRLIEYLRDAGATNVSGTLQSSLDDVVSISRDPPRDASGS